MKKAFAIVLAVWAAVCIMGCATAEEIPTEPEGYRIQVCGAEIAMNAPAEPALEALGTPKSHTEETSCAFDGLDKTYYYGSFYLTTYPAPDGDRVHSLWFADDTLTTPEGICIGSHREAVARAYDTETAGEDGTLTFSRGDSTLTIIFDGDTVSGIRYDAVVE